MEKLMFLIGFVFLTAAILYVAMRWVIPRINRISTPVRNTVNRLFVRLRPYLQRIMLWAFIALIIILLVDCFCKWWVKNMSCPKPATTATPLSHTCPNPPYPPFQRVRGWVKKMNADETVVRMNGSEISGIDTQMTVQPGQRFRVEQIEYCDPKFNRITYNYVGGAAPVWGGGNYCNDPTARYPIGCAANGVIIILKIAPSSDEYIFSFTYGQNWLEGVNQLSQPAKIWLYYNCKVAQIDKKGHTYNGHSQCGWDGSTATFRVQRFPALEVKTPQPMPTEIPESESPAPQPAPTEIPEPAE